MAALNQLNQERTAECELTGQKRMNLVYMLTFVAPACNRACICLGVWAQYHKPLELGRSTP